MPPAVLTSGSPLWLPSKSPSPPFLWHPDRGDHTSYPFGVLRNHLPCNSIHHLNSVLPDRRTKGGSQNRESLLWTARLARSHDIWGRETGRAAAGLKGGQDRAMGLRNTLAQRRCFITAQHAAVTYLGRVWGCMPMRDALNELRNRPLQVAREGQCIRGFLLLSTREEVNGLGPPHCSYWLFTITINTASKRSRRAFSTSQSFCAGFVKCIRHARQN